MNPKCRAALSAAQGRPLTDAQARDIESRIRGAAANLRRTDPNWSQMTADQRTLMAGQMAMQELQAEAAQKVANAERQAFASAAIESRAAQNKAGPFKMSRAESWADEIQKAKDESTVITKEYAGQLMGALEALKSGEGATLGRRAAMFLFDVDNPKMTADLAVEMHARGKGNTGNSLAVQAAKEFEAVNEAMRVRGNLAGKSVGRLEYGYMPHMWDAETIRAAGAEKFADAITPLVDRSYYVKEDGSQMSAAEVRDFMLHAAETLATGGANKHAPGQFSGGGARANRGHEHRQIHLKDGAAYLEAMRQFGGGSMYDAIMGHIRAQALDIAMIERMGPNPNAQHRVQRDLAIREAGGADAPLVAWSDLDHHYADLAGNGVADWHYRPPVVSKAIERVTLGKVSGRFSGAGAAQFMQHLRNIEVFSKLGGAVLSAISDLPLYMHTLNFNKLDYFQGIANATRSLTPLARREMVQFANSQGLIADSLIDSLNRMTGDHVGAQWSGNLAQSTMRLSLLNYWTDSLRTAFGLTMQQGLGRWVKKDFGALDEWTREVLLKSRGITEADWTVMQSAALKPTKWGDILTPEAIYATGHADAAGVVKRYMALLNHEKTMAIVEPDVAARAFLRRGTQAGSVGGEGLRLVSQFQAFPVALMTRHLKRILDTPQGLEGAPAGFGGATPFNPLLVLGAMFVGMTLFGGISLQMKALRDGKDPMSMDPADDKGLKFWTQAALQGGGLGHIGNLLLNAPEERGSRGWEGTLGVLGPVAGSAGGLLDLTQGNLAELAQGKDTHAGAEALRFAKGHAPLVNLWYTKTAIDRAVLNDAQEMLNPGYLARIKNKARKDWNQEFWWAPGEEFPGRPPDLGAANGK